MYFKTLLLLLLSLVAAQVSARQVITGKLIDKGSSQPVEFASVELLQLPDSSLVESITTNPEGDFVFYKSDTSKRYCLRIHHLSYKPLVVPVSKKTGMINNVGAILIEAAVIGMKEVVIGAYKIGVTELPDRTVYNVPNDMKKTSTDGLDVLRKLPSVQVDYLNENITVEGKSNIKLEVDGVTRDKEYFRKLHPSQLAKVEVITNPSGKYDAETDAVINIVTDTEMRYGLKGMFNVQGLPNSLDAYFGGINMSLDYGLDKITYYVAANGGVSSMEFLNTMERRINNTMINQDGVQKMNGRGGNFNTGFIYNPNTANSINFNVSYNLFRQNIDNVSLSSSSINDSILKNNSDGYIKGGGLKTLLYYKHKFNKNTQHGIEFETSYYNSLNNLESETSYQRTYFNNDAILKQDPWITENSFTKNQTASAQVTYTLPFDSVYTFITGINSNYNYYRIENTFSQIPVQGLDYKDLRGWFFAELTRSFKWGSLKLGSRVESSSVNINSTDKNTYISTLPYANIQYKLNSTNSIKLNYTKRVFRPQRNDLNPFESRIDSLTLSSGNPDLKPAYRDNIQLSYNLKVGKGKFTGSLSPQVFYEYRTGLIQRVSTLVPGTNGILRKPWNISDGYETGAGLDISFQLFTFKINSNVRYVYSHIDSYENINSLNRKSWNWNSTIFGPLPKNFTFFTVFYMTGPAYYGEEIRKSDPFYLLGIQKQFKNNSSLSILSFSPFSKKLFNSDVELNNKNLTQNTNSYMNLKYAFMIRFTYSFNLGKSLNGQQKRGIEQDEEGGGFMRMPF